jgi:hypothetical protein
MDAEKLTKLVQDAKYLFDHGAFTVLAQAEFFAALATEVAPAPPPAPPPAPLTEGSDGISATATTSSEDAELAKKGAKK